MLKRIFVTAAGTALLIFWSFTIGFNSPEIRSGKPGRVWAAVEAMPDRLSMLAKEENGGQLPILETYWSALTRISSQYYGAKIDERKLTYSSIRGMLAGLNDPFTRFLDPDEYKNMREENEGNFVGIGAQLDVNNKRQVYVKEPLPDSPALAAGIKSGDVIIKVDNKPIAGMAIDEVVKIIRGQVNTKVKLTIQRPHHKKLIDFVIVRQVVQYRIVQSRMQDEKYKIGYIRLWQFNEHSDQQMDEALSSLEKKGMRALIFDLRANPGGLLPAAVDIGSRFADSGPVVVIQERGGQKNSLNVDPSKRNHKKVPLAVLIDNHSASASEIVAGAIRDNKAGVLIGVKTYGKGVVQTIIPLRDGSAVSITTAKWFTPSGSAINKLGVNPDIVVKAPEVGFDSSDPEKDPQLKKALEVLREKLESDIKKSGTAKATIQ